MDHYSFNRPRRDGWLSWSCWLTDSGRLTHKVVTRPAISLAQDRESAPAKTGVLTTMLRHQLVNMFSKSKSPWMFSTYTPNVTCKVKVQGQNRRTEILPLANTRICGLKIIFTKFVNPTEVISAQNICLSTKFTEVCTL